MASEIDDGGPAFPMCGEPYGDPDDVRWTPGMTLRDYFAAKALAGMLANPKWGEKLPAGEEECAAHWAYSFADYMLRARAKGGAR